MEREIADFLIYLGSEKGLSPRTLEAYGRDLASLNGFLKGKIPTSDDIIHYFEHLKNN